MGRNGLKCCGGRSLTAELRQREEMEEETDKCGDEEEEDRKKERSKNRFFM